MVHKIEVTYIRHYLCDLAYVGDVLLIVNAVRMQGSESDCRGFKHPGVLLDETIDQILGMGDAFGCVYLHDLP